MCIRDREETIELDANVRFDASPVACLVMDFIDGCRLSEFSPIASGKQKVGHDCETSVADSILLAATLDSSAEKTGNQAQVAEGEEEGAALRQSPTQDALKASSSYKSKVVSMCADIADALAEAHRNNIWHNDITPKNIMVDRWSKPWLTDFGLAESQIDSGSASTFRGTCGYASPESVHGERGPRSDIFSLGATLYQLLTFEKAYDASTRGELLVFAKEYQVPEIEKTNPYLSADLCAVVRTAIAKNPEDPLSDSRPVLR